MSVTGNDTLKTRRTLTVDGKSYDYFDIGVAAQAAGLGDVSRLPFSLKVLLENLVRLENGRTVTVELSSKTAGSEHRAEHARHEGAPAAI